MFQPTFSSISFIVLLLLPLGSAINSGTPPCDALISAGLAETVLLPTSPHYEPRIDSWWSLNGRLHPWCLVQPRTAEEVSLALTTLIDVNNGAGDWYLALRSGGHSIVGSNNIDNGVTFDLGLLDGVTYDRETNVASVGPGGKWMNVYRTLLDEHNVTVVGGRDGDVGVGGFMLGGGISYFSSRKGLGADNMINAQVVLANGSIVDANAQENPDLWRALKGGGFNTGIVTRYDVTAFPARNISYGIRVISSNFSHALSEATVKFTAGSKEDPANALIPMWTHDPTIGPGIALLAIRVNTVGNLNTTGFDEINKILCISDSGMILESQADAAAGSEIPSGKRNAWRTMTFQNNAAILNRCAALHEDLVQRLSKFIAPDTFTTIMIPQPFPAYFADFGRQQGGNVLGLDRLTGDALLWTAGVALDPNKTDESDLAVAQTLLGEYQESLEEYAREIGGLEKFVDLNYADASQDPLRSFGEENVEFIRRAAEKYDPSGVFQKRFPGGFKISRVV